MFTSRRENPGDPGKEGKKGKAGNPRGPDGGWKLVTEFAGRIELYMDTVNPSHFNGTLVI